MTPDSQNPVIAMRGRGGQLVLGVIAMNALAFVALSGVVFFGWGEIFSLFPSTLTDTFGTRHAAANYGFIDMAQGIGSVPRARCRRAPSPKPTDGRPSWAQKT